MIIIIVLLACVVLILYQMRERLFGRDNRMPESEKINVLPSPPPLGVRGWLVLALLLMLGLWALS